MVKCLKISAVLIFLCLFAGCSSREEVYKQTRFFMDTVVEISLPGKEKDKQELNLFIDDAFKEIEEIEALMSRYREDSEISRLNSHGGKGRVKVSDATMQVIKRAIEITRISGGAFDITALSLLRLWGEGGEKHFVSEEEIRETLKLVGSHKIIVGGESLGFARPGMALDLGGIAKGYAVDQAITRLRRNRIKNALVNAGGDIFCLGMKSPREQWRIGIQHPRKPGQILTILQVKDRAVATSGDYERGKHIIDPRTGFPVGNTLISVTVLAPDCMTADALATAVFVLGPDKGLELINGLGDIEGIIVSRKEGDEINIDVSRGLKGKLELTP